MLLVRAIVRPSPIQGLGLFAAEPIPAGTIVCQWDDHFSWVATPEAVAALPDLARAHIERYGWRAADGNWRLSVDDSRFWNHSPRPNMRPIVGSPVFARVASRDIAEGEELTEDYSEFDPDFHEYAHTLRDPDAVTTDRFDEPQEIP